MFIKHGDGEQENTGLMHPENQWKAQVLEIRALDPNHVYLLVAYLQNPHELPRGGARDHHAPNELIPSNELAIIDALTVNGGFDITHWDEVNDEKPPPLPETYFWRQTYNVHSGVLSSLRRICVCRQPYNPSRSVMYCDKCANYLHMKCIIDDAATRAIESELESVQGRRGRRRSTNPSAEKTGRNDAERNGRAEEKQMGESLCDGETGPMPREAADDVHGEGIFCPLCSEPMR